MNIIKETKFLSKKQTKRNIQNQVRELLNEFNQAKPSTSYSIIDEPSTSHSVINAHFESNVDQDSDLNLDQRYNQQNNEFEDKELTHNNELKNKKLFNETSNITCETFQELYVSEEHDSSECESLSDDFLNKLRKWALTQHYTISIR